MGLGGIYFRETLSDSSNSSAHHNASIAEEPLDEIESGPVCQVVDSSSAALLNEINSKASKLLIWPFVLGLSICMSLVLLAAAAPSWVYGALLLACGGALYWSYQSDKVRKTVVLFYALDPHVESAFQSFQTSFASLCRCSRVWLVRAERTIFDTHDRKVNAGAGAIQSRAPVAPHLGAPPWVQANISIPVLPAGRQTFYFLPDRVLVWAAGKVGAVNYADLVVDAGQTRFIETGGVPPETAVVDWTWRYVNKDGGPDRRFSNNQRIPVVLYGQMQLRSLSGVRELLQTSNTEVPANIRSAVEQMALAISQLPTSSGEDSWVTGKCRNCGGSFEFPQTGIGETVVCPHCAVQTVLDSAAPPL